eukprot:SAG22_NODE_1251_length_5005_cov_22.891154_9_plen_132_part_00
MTRQGLEALYGLTLGGAAAKMGVSKTQFWKSCRRNDVVSWPKPFKAAAAAAAAAGSGAAIFKGAKAGAAKKKKQKMKKKAGASSVARGKDHIETAPTIRRVEGGDEREPGHKIASDEAAAATLARCIVLLT